MSSIRPYTLWILHCALLVLAVLFLAGNSGAFFENARYRTFSKQEIQTMEQTTATIETKFGEINLKFFPEVAPNHVNSFIELARDGFYDGTTFHRIVPGFVIQGGDPNTKSDDRSRHGMGGPGFTLKAEFSKLPHKRGSVSMARAANPDSAGSQFFICVADAPFLDGEYTIFGEVVEGMDVVDKIVSQPKDQRDNPIERVEMKVKVVTPKERP
jgi:peptidyl-prolyl cis-trans isomerase B (cyclophilin B)